MPSDPSPTLPLDALRQVATAVAANEEPSEVFELVARATRELLDVDSAGRRRPPLDPEQVSWVRGHHERPDGRGYPDGLTAGSIPDGAAILGVADAYDAMTVARPYSARLLADDALEECRRLSGVQFDADAVTALEAVLALGSGDRYASRCGSSGS
jgi:hypothetical protein